MALLSHIPCSVLPVVHDMPDQIAKTVGALLIGSDGKVLLGLRAPWKTVWPSYWDTIGGRVEPDESLDAANLSR
jgi:8-oxo-dGTP diphosphatase